ncbi:MAG: hypothetical protein GY953_30800 [bacterium]|nr:hypothetical protein [bacterium]
MPAGCDLEGNGTLDWFFRQWVYSNEIPSYRLEYEIDQGAAGQLVLRGAVTQSGVSDNFRMPVPVYIDFDGNVSLLGRVAVTGNSTSKPFEVNLPKQRKRVVLNYFHDVLANKCESVKKQ